MNQKTFIILSLMLFLQACGDGSESEDSERNPKVRNTQPYYMMYSTTGTQTLTLVNIKDGAEIYEAREHMQGVVASASVTGANDTGFYLTAKTDATFWSEGISRGEFHQSGHLVESRCGFEHPFILRIQSISSVMKPAIWLDSFVGCGL